ncbi:uncharacterized protein LOC121970513 isoform X2 [Zingiber officinale]|uniref:uncharacterized protein LOC121970513 isoform X2 n=1 Tax=Zingiber officinale TaxID=94328 RepID=UPI001C4A8B6E|nr:uncharacterized protein LOC121970513 isoform X2 [Zingiber officinale]
MCYLTIDECSCLPLGRRRKRKETMKQERGGHLCHYWQSVIGIIAVGVSSRHLLARSLARIAAVHRCRHWDPAKD